MARSKTVVIDEIHVTVRIPEDLPDEEAETVRESLVRDEFMARLRRAVLAVICEFPALTVVRVSLTR